MGNDLSNNSYFREKKKLWNLKKKLLLVVLFGQND